MEKTLVIKLFIELSIADILTMLLFLLVLMELFVNFVIVGNHDIPKPLWKRGKISISHTINERPTEANVRSRIGDWEVDTVAGQTEKACLAAITDRYSCFLKNPEVTMKKSQLVIEAMVKMLELLAKDTVTTDKGKKFSNHLELAEQLPIEVHFLNPHAP